MVENFQDNISYGGSTLAVSGDAVAVGSTNAGAKSIIFNNTGSQGHLAWQPTANRTINLPDLGGTVQLTGQVPGAIYDGANSISTGTIRFTNANGVSFSINGQTISGSVAAQTNQSVGLYALGNTTQNSSTTLDARTLSFNGLGAATVGYSNGSIQISVPTQTAQTQSNIQGIYDGANSISTGTIRFTNANGVSFSINGQTISGSVAAQTAQTIGLYAVSNTTQNSSTTLDARTLSFQGAGVASVGYSNGSVIISVPSGGGGITNVNLSAGTTSNNLSAFVFSNSNNVSFGLNGSTVTATITVPAQTNQSVGLYALGNTTQNSSTTLDARTLSFNGLGAATVGYSNGSIQISVPAALGSVNISAGTTSNNVTNFVFSNSNNVSFGLNGSTVTATITVPAQTNQSVGLYALGNTTQNSSTTLDARTLSFNGLGIITAGYSNGSIQISATQSAQSVGLYALGNTTQNSSTTLDARTLSFNGLGIVTAGYSNGSIQISATQSADSVGLYALGNTTQNSSTTRDIRSLSFNGLGAATIGYSNGSIQVSVPVQTNQSVGLYALGNTTQNSSTTLDARTLSFNGLGALSVGYSNGSVQLSVPGNTLVFSNSNNISFGSAGATTITASYNPTPIYSYEPYPMQNNGTGFLSMGTGSSGSATFIPFYMEVPVAVEFINMIQSASLVTTGVFSGRQTVTQSYGLYSRGTGANSTTLSVITSGSYSIGFTYNNLTMTINHPTTTNSNGYSTGSTSSAGINLTGTYDTLALIQYPINSTMTPGNYWLGIFAAQSTTSNNCGFSQSILGNQMSLTALAPFGSASSNSGTNAINGALNANWLMGFGVFSSAAQTNLPSTVALSAITQNGSIIPYMKFISTL